VASGVFRVIASLQVGQRERVVVVQVGDRQVLLGVAPGRVGLIQELAEPLQDAAGVAPKAPAFNAPTWVQRVLSKSQ
jgi:flagellar protein FliO/FliZ